MMEKKEVPKNIRFAFAVSHAKAFESCHFGDADMYLIFEWNGEKIAFKNDLKNPYKNMDESQGHGSPKKGKAIIDLLKENDIQVMVSKQFGKNITLVNRFFIPIIIDKETIEDALNVLSQHLNWIKDELEHNVHAYKLFMLKKGILKVKVTT